MGAKTTTNYQKFFDGSTPRDYEIARLYTSFTVPQAQILLFGEIMHKYITLSNKLPPGRYAVAYHITNYKDGIRKHKGRT